VPPYLYGGWINETGRIGFRSRRLGWIDRREEVSEGVTASRKRDPGRPRFPVWGAFGLCLFLSPAKLDIYRPLKVP
jgi:hypothetical protein